MTSIQGTHPMPLLRALYAAAGRANPRRTLHRERVTSRILRMLPLVTLSRYTLPLPARSTVDTVEIVAFGLLFDESRNYFDKRYCNNGVMTV